MHGVAAKEAQCQRSGPVRGLGGEVEGGVHQQVEPARTSLERLSLLVPVSPGRAKPDEV